MRKIDCQIKPAYRLLYFHYRQVYTILVFSQGASQQPKIKTAFDINYGVIR